MSLKCHEVRPLNWLVVLEMINNDQVTQVSKNGVPTHQWYYENVDTDIASLEKSVVAC